MSQLDESGTEYEGVRERAGVREIDTGVLVLKGDDRLEFLNRIVTAELEGIKEGGGRRALLLTANGRIRADLRILNSGDELMVLMHEMVVDELQDEWGANIFIEDVEIEKPGYSVITIQGPESLEVVSEVTGSNDLPEDLHYHTIIETEEGTKIRAVRSDSTGEGGYDLLVPEGDVDDVLRVFTDAGASTFSRDTHTVLRTEAGIPDFLRELKGRIPLDAGLYDIVSFDKGCYTGQEVVARVEQRGGGPKKRLIGLRFNETEYIDVKDKEGTDIEHEGEDTGEVTTLVESPLLGPIGMGYVNKDIDIGKTAVKVGRHEATLTELPFER